MSAIRVTTRRPREFGSRVLTWSAYLLAVVCPGAGHLCVRQWKRGLSWGTLCGVAIVFLSPGTLLFAGPLIEPILVTALRLETVTFADVAFPLTIVVLNVIDLYSRLALDETTR
ncbi:hypothetical protein RBH26_03115 [Natronolimnohabitans sp. A-GB9]|uniref:hypothetical protein n=1 Tax=Natronolimnohabitans sp. A-GB9 TaxID=3069757 RepID=UPI0027ADB462|nr:hypothetical protein [Natronolimnohabitans sp. A-GB9]MDQ2049467.1 hypothetical protein [Natronolimnohabitans sp. A-GB9]